MKKLYLMTDLQLFAALREDLFQSLSRNGRVATSHCPSLTQSWWYRCSFDKLYLWIITCGDGEVFVLMRQISCPAPTIQRLSGHMSSIPPTPCNERVSRSCVRASHWSESRILITDWSLYGWYMCGGMCDVRRLVSCLRSVSLQFIWYRHDHQSCQPL